MTDYVVKIRFLIAAYDGVTIEAANDQEAIAKAQIAAASVMRSSAWPDHVDADDRCEGIIAYIDRISPKGREAIVEDLDLAPASVDPPPRTS